MDTLALKDVIRPVGKASVRSEDSEDGVLVCRHVHMDRKSGQKLALQ